MSNETTAFHAVKVKNQYSTETKQEVALLLLTTGNLREVSKLTKIPYETILDWKNSDWWPDVERRARQQRQEAMQRNLLTVADLALDKVRDRLENGEYILNNKTGALQQKPVSLRDATNALNAVMDKAIRLDNDTVIYTENQSVSDLLKNLASEFAKFTNKKKTDVVDVEFKEV